MCFAPQPRGIFWTSHLQKVVRTRQFCNIFTCKCAFRHSGVQFLNIVTSKMAPPPWCFPHFDLQICFAPQRRAIFHLSARTATSAPAALARLLFEHQQPRIIEKTQRFATSLTFFRACWTPCYWLCTPVDLLAPDSTHMLIFLLLTWLLCDSSLQLYILSEVRPSKLPSIILYILTFLSYLYIWYLQLYTSTQNCTKFWAQLWILRGRCS